MSDQNQNRPIIIKKIIKKAGGHHGGSWKVAYADFVTALMAFFLLMWLVTALSQQQKKGVAQYVQSYKVGQGKGEGKGSGGKPSGPIDGKGEGIFDEKGISILEGEGIGAGGEGSGMSAESVQEMLLSNIQERLSELKDQILVSLSKGNVRIEIVDKDERSIFPSGSSEPSPETVKILKEIAQSVTKLGNKVVIEGHTDATSYSTNRYTNWELSTDRASAARKILEDNGLNPDRSAMVAGYAATLPLIPENPNDPKNRRISITLLYNPATIPGR